MNQPKLWLETGDEGVVGAKCWQNLLRCALRRFLAKSQRISSSNSATPPSATRSRRFNRPIDEVHVVLTRVRSQAPPKLSISHHAAEPRNTPRTRMPTRPVARSGAASPRAASAAMTATTRPAVILPDMTEPILASRLILSFCSDCMGRREQ
jgi:hypothetical protein